MSEKTNSQIFKSTGKILQVIKCKVENWQKSRKKKPYRNLKVLVLKFYVKILKIGSQHDKIYRILIFNLQYTKM